MQQPPNPYPQFQQPSPQQWQQQLNYTQPQSYQQQPARPPQQPPFPPQQYQQPPQYQPPMPPPKQKSRKRLWLILAAVVLLLAVIIGVASQGQNQQSTPTTQATQQPATQATKATQQPTTQPTQKPTAIPVTHAVLGGTVDSFEATFAHDAMYTTAGRARAYTFSVDGQQGTIIAMLDDNDSNVRFITLRPADPTAAIWDAKTGQDAVRLFMPTDAHHIKDIQDSLIGTEHVYMSATLAKTFPASSFTDTNSGNRVAVGTFYFNCDNGQNQVNPTHIGACTIGLGQ